MVIALLVSVILNILFLLVGILLINRRGGISYAIAKIHDIMKPESADIPVGTSTYYLHQTSQFQILPKSNLEIVFLGDSLTDECEWAELINNPNIKNRGISGDTTIGILNRLDDILNAKPKQIFLMFGINDFIHYRRSAEQVFEDYKKIVIEIRRKSPNTEIFIQSVLPVNKTEYKVMVNNDKVIELNLYLQKLAKELSSQYIDLFSLLSDSQNQLDSSYTLDGVHLNGQAYSKWAQAIEQHIVN